VAEKRWIEETLFDKLGFHVSYEVDKILYEVATEHQQLVLFENKFFGKMLVLDGAVQITSRDEYVYQEMMSHVPLFAHGNARQVLIVGGGDCGIAEEVLKHESVERLTQVEIDASVVEFAKEHYPEFTKPVFADKRFECIIDDGMKFVTETDRRFDAIIVDSTDPQGPGAVLFTKEFYAHAIFASCSPTAHVIWLRSRLMSAATWRWALPPTTRRCDARRPRRSPSATRKPVASLQDIGRLSCRSAPLRSHVSSPIWWPGRRPKARRKRGRGHLTSR